MNYSYSIDYTMRHSIHKISRVPLFLLLFCFALVTFSCGSDDPDLLIGYYMSINTQVKLTLSEDDESQGTTTPNMTVDVLSNTVRNMKKALHDAYPQDTRKGADAAVLTAIDDIYNDYKKSYADKEGHTVCVINLYRAKKDHDIVVQSTPLKTYSFGALPLDTTALGH